MALCKKNCTFPWWSNPWEKVGYVARNGIGLPCLCYIWQQSNIVKVLIFVPLLFRSRGAQRTIVWIHFHWQRSCCCCQKPENFFTSALFWAPLIHLPPRLAARPMDDLAIMENMQWNFCCPGWTAHDKWPLTPTRNLHYIEVTLS